MVSYGCTSPVLSVLSFFLAVFIPPASPGLEVAPRQPDGPLHAGSWPPEIGAGGAPQLYLHIHSSQSVSSLFCLFVPVPPSVPPPCQDLTFFPLDSQPVLARAFVTRRLARSRSVAVSLFAAALPFFFFFSHHPPNPLSHAIPPSIAPSVWPSSLQPV